MSIRSQCARLLTILLASYGLASCGTTVPNIKEVWDRDMPADPSKGVTTSIPGAAQIEFEIKKRVFCELKAAVKTVNRIPATGASGRPIKLLPDSWGAQVSLSLQADGISALNPGVTFNNPMPNAFAVFLTRPIQKLTFGQSFSFGLGGTLSSSATRVDKYDPYYSIAFLMEPDTPRDVCRPENDPFRQLGWTPAKSSPFILESDLGIQDWLTGAVMVDYLLHSVGGKAAVDAVSYEIKFIIVSSGNVTPTWRLIRVTANTVTPLFNMGRTRTHDLIITVGPSGDQATYAHLASQIGNAVSNANRAQPSQ